MLSRMSQANGVSYAEKLGELLRHIRIRRVTLVRMKVSC